MYSSESDDQIIAEVDGTIVATESADDVNSIDITANDLPNNVDLSGLALEAIESSTAELGAGDDTFIGSMAPDVINGGAGNDDMYGGGRADEMDGGDGDDTMSGNGGDDSMNGSNGDDTLRGQAGDDVIDAGLGDDRIDGVIASGSAEHEGKLVRAWTRQDYTITEGESLQLSGGGELIDLTDMSLPSSPAELDWDLDNDGNFDDGAGAAPIIDWPTMSGFGWNLDDGPFQIRLRAKAGELEAFALAVLNIAQKTNSPPKIDLDVDKGGLQKTHSIEIGPDRSGENTTVRHLHWVQATDMDSEQLQYSIVGGSPDYSDFFEIKTEGEAREERGRLRLKEGIKYSDLYNKRLIWQLSIRVQDTKGNSDTGVLTIKLRQTSVGIMGDTIAIEGPNDKIKVKFVRVTGESLSKPKLTVDYRFRWNEVKYIKSKYLSAADLGVAPPWCQRVYGRADHHSRRSRRSDVNAYRSR